MVGLDHLFPEVTFSPTLKERFDAMTVRQEDGCLLPVPGVEPQISYMSGETTTLGRAAWLLRYHRLPTANLRRTCGCAGCVEVKHLEEVPPKRGYVPRRSPLTPAERARVKMLYHTHHRTLRDIAYEFRVSAQTISRVVGNRRT